MSTAPVMTNNLQPMALDLVLPWEPNPEQEEKFKKQLRRVLLPFLLLLLFLSWLPPIETELEVPEEELTVTKLILKPVIEPEPVVVQPKEVVPPKEEIKEIPKPKEKAEPKPKAAAIKTPSKKSSGSAKKTAVKTEKVEEKVSVRSSQGLDDLSSQLAALRSSVNTSSFKQRNLATNTDGTKARSSRERLGNDQVTRKSGGIDVDGNVMRNSSTTLASHTTTAVDGLVVSGSGPSGDQSYLSSQVGLRDMESIRRTLEGTKSNIFSLYQRARLDHPELEGKFVFKFLIEPDGSISDLQLISSELGLNELEKNILAKIKKINFGPEDVSQTEVEYKFVFLPS